MCYIWLELRNTAKSFGPYRSREEAERLALDLRQSSAYMEYAVEVFEE